MTFKSKTQPLCRWCGTPIRKQTITWYTGQDSSEPITVFSRHVRAKPNNRQDCMKLAGDLHVVSVSWHGGADTSRDRHIWRFTTWDGESYAREFFCSSQCGEFLGTSAARDHKLAGKVWHDAKRRQELRGES